MAGKHSPDSIPDAATTADDTPVVPLPAQPLRAMQTQQTASPLVDGDTVTFALHAANAQSVELALNYPYAQPLPMQRADNGVWRLRVGPLPPRLYPYFFLVDGLCIADPSNPNTGQRINVGYSLVEVAGATPRADERQPVPHGVLHRHHYRSSAVDAERLLWVYTPPGYDALTAAGKHLPVLYLRHGAEQVEDSWFAAGRADTILDNLIANGLAQPMLLVGCNGYASPQTGGILRRDRNTPNAMRLLGQELVDDIVPLVASHYRVSGNPQRRALAGLSMGAGQAFVIGWRHAGTFGTIGCFSSGIISAPDFDLHRAAPNLAAANGRNLIDNLWLGCGRHDRRRLGHQALCQTLAELGIRHTYTEVDGSHEWRTWRALLAQFLPSLFTAD